MDKSFEVLGYEITGDPNFLDNMNHITPELGRQIPMFHQLSLEGKKSSIPKFLKAIEKYPKNPQLKNYLSVLYMNAGMKEKSYEANKWLISEHPDYLFGKLNLCNQYFQNKEYHKIPEIVGKDLEIKSLYPHRDKFHVKEVSAFYNLAIRYFSVIGDLNAAETRLKILEKIDPDGHDMEMARKHYSLALMSEGMKRWEREESERIEVTSEKMKTSKKTEAPIFHHPEVEKLYKIGLYISKEDIDVILSLPRKSLIADLEKILRDSVDRFYFWKSFFKKNEYKEEITTFMVHALYFLGDLEAEESTDAVLNILGQPEEYHKLFFSEFLTSALWEPLYKILKNQAEKCRKFFMLPGKYTYSRDVMPRVLAQVALQHPERRVEVIQWFKDVMHELLNSKIEDNIIDSNLIGLFVCYVVDLQATELLPLTKKLFEKKWVDTSVCGTYEEVESDTISPAVYSNKEEILPLSDRYKNITSTWYYYTGKEVFHRNGNDTQHPLKPEIQKAFNQVINEQKVGRNDPCPCGSGKKFKKCCINLN